MNEHGIQAVLPALLTESLTGEPDESLPYHIRMSLAGRDQTVYKPEEVAAQQKEIPGETRAEAPEPGTAAGVVEGSATGPEERGGHKRAGKAAVLNRLV